MHDTIKGLLFEIAKLPSASHIVIFGSIAKGSATPADVDLALVVDDCSDWQAAVAAHGPTIHRLRYLARQHYGWLDPFVKTKAGLVVRNDEATGWKAARNARALMSAIRTDGVPLSEIVKRHIDPTTWPPFKPMIFEEFGETRYADGRVVAAVDTATTPEHKSIVIHEWTSTLPGRGHTAQALQWMRDQGFTRILANGVGLIEDGVGDIATAYWEHMHSRGLVDVLLDDNGVDVTPAKARILAPGR